MLRRLVIRLFLSLWALTLVACGGARATLPAGDALPSRAAPSLPQAYQQNNGAQFVEYSTHCSAALGQIAQGGDGATIWFLAPKSCVKRVPAQIGFVTIATGAISEFALSKDLLPTALAPNAGYVWVAVKGEARGGAHTMYRYGRGSSTSYSLPDELTVTAMTTGPDGNVWFAGTYVSGGATLAATGYVTPSGATTIFQVTGKQTPILTSLAAGSDGNIWLTDERNGAVVKVVPATGTMTPYAVGGHPYSITNSSNKLVYSDEKTAQLSVLATSGVATVYPAPKAQFPGVVARKTDGTVVYVDTANGAQALGTFDPSSGTYAPEAPAPSDGLRYLVNGPDGNMWFTDAHGNVGAYLKFVLATTPASIVLGTSTCTTTFSVSESNYRGNFNVSTNSDIATVSPTSGTSSTTFTVTDVGPGQTTVEVQDTMQNVVTIPLTVTGACGSDQYYLFYTGGQQAFTVPSGVTSLRVDAYGGASSGTNNGGFVEATIPATPGASLAIFVGGNSSQGGYNGGGPGGPAGGIRDAGPGSPGAGASDVRQGGIAPGDRVIVAGGAGGSGDLAGGAGGGSIGAAGQDEPYPAFGGGGGGGTQTSGGAGGAGGVSGCADASPGSNGFLETGGSGGQGAPYGQLLCYPADGGGGGGGGYYGGGGGGGGTTNYGYDGQSGGGGGGSSYVEPSATNVTNMQGGSPGGLVIFSWGSHARARPAPFVRSIAGNEQRR